MFDRSGPDEHGRSERAETVCLDGRILRKVYLTPFPPRGFASDGPERGGAFRRAPTAPAGSPGDVPRLPGTARPSCPRPK